MLHNFVLMNRRLRPEGILEELAAKPHLWNSNRARTANEASPFKDVSDIILRYNPDLSSIDKVINGLECVCYPAWGELPMAREIAYTLNYVLQGFRIGRVLITKLPPGGKMLPHVDQGANAAYYDRFQICLQADGGSLFNCGDESCVMSPGEVWWFNNKLLHSVENSGEIDRIHMIVDLKL